MSLDARGKFAGALVFSGWKGRPTVRQLVTPANPKSANQAASRNRVRVAAAGQHWANLSTLKGGGRVITDKEALIAAAPAGQAWNGTLNKAIIGLGDVNYTAATTAYNALTAGQKTAWDTAAAALTPAIGAVAQATAGGGTGTPMPAGEVWFHYQYGLYVLGIASAPSGTPPTYA